MALTVELSRKAKENLDRNKDIRRKESKFISIDENCYVILNFDPEKIEPPIENISFGIKKTRYIYITSFDDYPDIEKTFETNWYTSLAIDRYLRQGHKRLKVERIGSGKETRYTVSLP